MPRGKKTGYYPLIACMQWRIRYWEQRASTMARIEAARLRKELAQAEKIELDNQERRGSLVRAEGVSRAIGELLQVVRDNMRSIPARATRLTGEERAWLAAEIDAALDAGARTLQSMEFDDPPVDEAGDEAAANAP